MGNQVTCLKVLPQQIQTIVNLAAEHQEKAPEFLDLLNNIVKVKYKLSYNFTYIYLSCVSRILSSGYMSQLLADKFII